MSALPPGPLDEADDRIALVASVGPLDAVVVVLRELLHVASAVRATAVVPPGAQDRSLTGPAAVEAEATEAGAGTAAETEPEPTVVDVARLAPIEVARGAQVVHLAHAGPLDAPIPPLPAFRELPTFDADPTTGDVQAPLGGVEHRARNVALAAELLPPGTVLQLSWDTVRPDVPFSVTARAGDDGPLVIGIGEEAFPMPTGWPPPGATRD